MLCAHALRSFFALMLCAHALRSCFALMLTCILQDERLSGIIHATHKG